MARTPLQQARQFADQEAARCFDAVDIDRLRQRRHVSGIRRRERERDQRRVTGAIDKKRADNLHHGARYDESTGVAPIRGKRLHCADKAALRGVPAIDRIAVVRDEEGELGVGMVEQERHWRGIAAQQRRNRLRRPRRRNGTIAWLAADAVRASPARRGLAILLERNVAAIRPDAGRPPVECATATSTAVPALPACVARMSSVYVASAASKLPVARDHRRARLAVPALELREVDARRILHRLREIVAGHRLPVVALEVEVHAAPEPLGPEQRVLHAG